MEITLWLIMTKINSRNEHYTFGKILVTLMHLPPPEGSRFSGNWISALVRYFLNFEIW